MKTPTPDSGAGSRNGGPVAAVDLFLRPTPRSRSNVSKQAGPSPLPEVGEAAGSPCGFGDWLSSSSAECLFQCHFALTFPKPSGVSSFSAGAPTVGFEELNGRSRRLLLTAFRSNPVAGCSKQVDHLFIARLFEISIVAADRIETLRRGQADGFVCH